MARPAAPKDLDQALAEAAGGRRAVVQYAGKRLAVVPASDLRRLEELEDAAEARAALAEFEASGEPASSSADVRGRLGL